MRRGNLGKQLLDILRSRMHFQMWPFAYLQPAGHVPYCTITVVTVTADSAFRRNRIQVKKAGTQKAATIILLKFESQTTPGIT